MLRVPVALSLMLLAGPALAQVRPAAPLGPEGAQVRSLSIRNQSGQPVVSAEVQTTDGKTRALTHSPIGMNGAREIVLPRDSCIRSVSVGLKDGRELKLDKMDDCRSPVLIVGNQGIDVMGSDVRRAQRKEDSLPAR